MKILNILIEGYNTAVGSVSQGEGTTGAFGKNVGVVGKTQTREKANNFFTPTLSKGKETKEETKVETKEEETKDEDTK